MDKISQIDPSELIKGLPSELIKKIPPEITQKIPSKLNLLTTNEPNFWISVVVFLITLFAVYGMLFHMAWFWGFDQVDIKTKVDTHPSTKTASRPTETASRPTETINPPEVFNVKSQPVTYEHASKVCAKYQSRLATKDELELAHGHGANFCSLGWVKGQQAYYPIQSEQVKMAKHWPQGLQDLCGKVGINGGHYNPKLKLGVNCFGQKPPRNSQLSPWNTIKNQWSMSDSDSDKQEHHNDHQEHHNDNDDQKTS